MTEGASLTGDAIVRSHLEKAHIREADYRPDIDGLRALAVAAVIGFHAFPTLLPGGFVGVDVFFVISGYLISKHILGELAAEKFSLRAFYVRRIKRIFPALTLVLALCTAVGWVMLTPDEYEALGGPIAGGAGFVANFVFWKQAGYFDRAADTKPLLHLWSLGIEEQFYILWPTLLGFVSRRAPGALGRTIVGLCAASLLYSLWLVQHDRVADFYSPLSRFWELGLGAALAYASLRRVPLVADAYRPLLSWLGLALVVLAVLVIQRDGPFPGAWALLPTLGTACLIQAGMGAQVNRGLLASAPFVWVGLISYPLYLWHWPLLSFARVFGAETPSIDVRLLLVASSVILAVLTYRFAELPVRATPTAQAGRLVRGLALAMLVLLIAGAVVRKFDGFKFRALSRLDGDVGTLALGADRDRLKPGCGVPASSIRTFDFCRSSGDPPAFAVIGDSKGEAIFYGLAREAGPSMPGVLIGTVVAPSLNPAPDDRLQAKYRLGFDTVANTPSIKSVVLAVALRDILPAEPETGFVKGDPAPAAALRLPEYAQVAERFAQAGKRTIFLIDNPTLPDPRSCISGGMTSSEFLNRFLRRAKNTRCTIRYSDHVAGTAAYRQFAQELARRSPGVAVYDPTPLLCDVPRDACSVMRDGKFLYSYSDHISDHANSLIARELLPLMQP